MLACARIGAPHNVVFGGFSPDAVKERMEFSEAKALITVDQARRKGKAADIKPAVDAFLDDVPSIETVIVVRNTGADVADEGGPRPLLRRGDRGRLRGLPGRAARRRAPALRALHVGLDRQAEGHPAHDRRLPHRRGVDDQARVRPQARRGRVLVLGRRRLGHRPLLHRLRAADERHDLGHVRGRARLPAQGHLVGAVRALRRDGLLHRADRDPRVHEVGHLASAEGRPLEAAAARHRRRADQPEGLALVLEADRRRALPDRRHLVADRDRPHHDHDAAGGAVLQARLGGQAAARDRRRGARRGGQRGARRRAGPARAAPALAGDAAHAPQGRRALQGDLLLEVGRDDLLRRRRGPPGRGRLLLGRRPGGRRGERVRPPAVDRGGGVGDRVAPARSPRRP